MQRQLLPNEIGKKCFAYTFYVASHKERIVKNDKKVTLKRQYIG